MLKFGQKGTKKVTAMASVTIELSEERLQALQDLAKSQNIPLDILLRSSLESWLSAQQADFQDATNYVLNKNTELYQRLA